MGNCKCIDKNQDQNGVILEENYKKHENFMTLTGLLETNCNKSQALCRGYLDRQAFKKDLVPKDNIASEYQNLISSEAQEVLKKILNLTPFNSKTFHKLEDGSVYFGQLNLNNLPEGEGEKVFCDRTYLRGNWVNGECSGSGVMVFTNGDYYQGNFFNGKFEGIGKLVNADFQSYEGQWVKGKQHGLGVER